MLRHTEVFENTRNIKTAIESADVHFTLASCYSNCSLLTKKKPTRFGKALKKSAGCIIFVKKERKCWIRNPLPTLMTDYGKEVLIRQFFKQKLDWLKYQIVPSLACCFTVLFISNVVKSSTGGSPPGAPVNIVKEVENKKRVVENIFAN